VLPLDDTTSGAVNTPLTIVGKGTDEEEEEEEREEGESPAVAAEASSSPPTARTAARAACASPFTTGLSDASQTVAYSAHSAPKR
jgi:hypothetical protein